MKKLLMFCVVAGLILATSGPASASLDYLKWMQPPDMGATGMDFYPEDYVGLNKINMMASDWKCETGLPVTDFHWWGSWEGEPNPDFTVVLYVFDDDAGKPKLDLPIPIWSYPVVVLDPGFTQGYYGTDGAGNDVYWYQIDLPEPDWFHQEIGKNYWFAINSPTAPGERYGWGWHNTADHEKYDSVYFSMDDMAWYYLTYPGGHPWAGQSADLAFAVSIPEPTTICLLGLGALALLRNRRA